MSERPNEADQEAENETDPAAVGASLLDEIDGEATLADLDVGNLRISDDVVGIIAGVAASEIDGVAGMSGGFVGDITEMLGKKNRLKGVKVDVGEKEAALDLYIVVEYGVQIPRLAHRVQENVKSAVEAMTGLKAVEVNIHIQGVAIQSSLSNEFRAR